MTMMKIDDENVKIFLKYIKKVCKENGVRIFMYKNKNYINDDGIKCAAYFTESPKPKIVIAVKEDIKYWLPVLVHEIAHMYQYLEGADVWKNLKFGNSNSLSEFFTWLAGDKEIHKELLFYHMNMIARLEADAENRSIQMIKEFNLPIDLEDYIQKANTNVWFYRAVMETRSWFTEGKSKNFKKLYKLTPKTLTKNPSTPNKKFLETCKKVMF